ncbi:MAG: hypothetical protein COW25_00345 [Candidatus Nealsonbacteria bacterium CG15_BIG_FIL_POST_REV_8_21_14_020_37_12]|uniref:Uncharacterized protein n=1 Tax=Candidatus Nealsonbacteria bacterium CG15_BIG_FIL_POST_REV_8_21_14_020_37_12 TaxID=1974716 RepID=A0A2M7H1W5_9BACT|nr:MAG: hypothetical protein COW25_00345 [Candidatus Nealsonbacteria bacterium CG15_BIG_FIL_POST_REV_8_21_14_020_37_12]
MSQRVYLSPKLKGVSPESKVKASVNSASKEMGKTRSQGELAMVRVNLAEMRGEARTRGSCNILG